jgi:hypothetical protein
MNLPKGALRTLAESFFGDGDHLPQAANFKAEDCSYRSNASLVATDTLP